jgi:hypothetical protein
MDECQDLGTPNPTRSGFEPNFFKTKQFSTALPSKKKLSLLFQHPIRLMEWSSGMEFCSKQGRKSYMNH